MNLLILFGLVVSTTTLFIKPISPTGKEKPISIGGKTPQQLEKVRSLLAKINEKNTKEIGAKHGQRAQQVDDTLDNHDFGPRKENQSSKLLITNRKIQDYLYQGDLNLEVEQLENMLSQSSSNGRKKRVALYTPATLWDINSPISYVFDSNIDPTFKVLIREGMDFWQNNTCLSFKENAPGQKLFITAGQGCYSSIGKLSGGQQTLSLGSGCEYSDTVIHELGHVLGSAHTQSRNDRDNFITINTANIDPSMLYNFDKLTATQNNNLGIQYDYGSVMQYPPSSFGTDSSIPSMIATDIAYQKTMGSGFAAYTDLLAINTLYKCVATKCPNSYTTCLNSGYMNPKDCTKCVCPPMFSGKNCADRNPGTFNGGCGKTINVTSTSWTSLSDTVGDDNWPAGQARSVDCYYHLKVPTGRRVEVQIITSGDADQCGSECYYYGLQLFNNGTTKAPMTFCCPTEAQGKIFRSVEQTSILRGWTRYNPFSFQIQYRYVQL